MWRGRVKIEALESAPVVTRGSLAADVDAFLRTLPKGRRRDDFENLLGHWTDRLGHMRRPSVGFEEVRDALAEWQGSGISASTLNKRRQALISLYRHFDGRGHRCPAVLVPKFKEPKPVPRALDLAFVRQIFASMQDSQTKARLMLQFFTACRPSELMRVRPEDIRIEDRCIYFRTGKDGNDRAVPLNDEGVAAAQMFVKFHCFGRWSLSSVRKSFMLAAKKAAGGNLEALVEGERPTGRRMFKVRPYDLRHTMLTTLRRGGMDLADVADYAGHKSPQTTKRYAPRVDSKHVAAVASIPSMLESPAGVGTQVPDSGTT